MVQRAVKRVFRGVETRDGAGVRLRRVFGFGETEELDPFLLLDAFGATDPRDYLAGFPWHPHRGIETVTYLLEGSVRHGDSLGTSGTIGPGELQWMTAGSGIIHEEMPQRSPRGVYGFQLWVNLPRAEKMRDPAYRGVKAEEVPVVAAPGGSVKVLAGSYGGRIGPVRGVARDPTYLDLCLDPRAGEAPEPAFELEAPEGETAFAFVYEGSLRSAGAGPDGRPTPLAAGDCALFGPGDLARLEAGGGGARLVFARALPLRESVAWRGPIVMNTEEELDLAFREYAAGTFVKKRG